MRMKSEHLWIALILILFSAFYVIRPVVTTLLGTDRSISLFAVGVLFSLFLPTLVHALVSLKTKRSLYAVIPAACLIAGQILFFRDYATWIVSDANAAIALLFIPFYLFGILGASYLVAFLLLKWRD